MSVDAAVNTYVIERYMMDEPMTNQEVLVHAVDKGAAQVVSLMRRMGCIQPDSAEYFMTDLANRAAEEKNYQISQDVFAMAFPINCQFGGLSIQGDDYAHNALRMFKADLTNGVGDEGCAKEAEMQRALSTLMVEGLIPEKYMVSKALSPLFSCVDCEKTLRNIKDLNFWEERDLREEFNLALRSYAKKGQIDVVRALLLFGADLNARGYDGSTALALATLRRKEDVAEFLIQEGADVNTTLIEGKAQRYGINPLCNAAERGLFKTVGLLVQRGADLEFQDTDGDTPLSLAIQTGEEAIVEFLIEAKANVNSIGVKGHTPLFFSVEHPKIMRLLLENGAAEMIDHTNIYGLNALDTAAIKKQPEAVELLMEYGADLSFPKKQDDTAFH